MSNTTTRLDALKLRIVLRVVVLKHQLRSVLK